MTLSKNPLPCPGMDFDLLRKEGIEHIRRMAGHIWTDHNTHDPGITILEHLCYAITDLSYRISFDMADLFAADPEIPESECRFFTAKEILPTNPVTISDYRKLLIDIEGVKNAWLELIINPKPELYYHSNKKRSFLTLDPGGSGRPIAIRGLYRVVIEKDYTGLSHESIKEKILSRLHNHRNLCEDFAEIKILPLEEINVSAEIEIDEDQDAETVLAKILYEIETYISPSIRFYSLKDLLQKGKSVEEIFYGPSLKHGFIDDDELEHFGRKSELHVSDIIQSIFNCDHIVNIRKINISSDQLPDAEEWVLKLSPDHTPSLKNIETLINEKCIKVCKKNIPCNIDVLKVKDRLEKLKGHAKTLTTAEDLPVSKGEYRELAVYETIQNDFPSNYGIGEAGLPDSVPDIRKAQAKQLKAFLMFFDQILSDYFSQLDNSKNIFSFLNKGNATYFPGNPANTSEIDDILKIDKTDLLKLMENEKTAAMRKNRILDHLLAIFSENFSDHVLLMFYPDWRWAVESKNRKQELLSAYPEIGYNRTKAVNYFDKNSVITPGNVPGLKQRITGILGLSEIESKFEIIEHILFRPKNIQDAQQFKLTLNKTLSDSDDAPGKKKDGFSVLHPDPFSFRITFVLPNWPTRFRDDNFRSFVHDTLSAETPTHIYFNVIWFNEKEMEVLRNGYKNFLNDLETGAGCDWEKAGILMKLLEIGKVKQNKKT